MKFLFSIMMSVMLLAACSSTRVVTDYNPRANFTTYQKFTWAADPASNQANTAISPFLQEHLKASLSQRLKTGLYQEVQKIEQADFIVRPLILPAPDTIDRSPRLGIGLGSFSSNVGIGTSVGIPLGADRVNQNIQIVIDLLNAKDQKLAWRGSLVIELDSQDPKENQIRIDDAVSEIWAEFPPK
ncbi:DUF4136 domain-containing protein [Spongiibacter sp. KMU-158]|uniref:DUF4136 domain-containing protein n=1 Tax=Spongiibacter pelagi TaxID=2760804 RepID=A0A927C157_9GAMM|nr:DUF4136 domain-containing protein [Spongiibacter pelagi]MBD2857982.1 DUF4136 domain-containing protein [Spongiibacter pelagi]